MTRLWRQPRYVIHCPGVNWYFSRTVFVGEDPVAPFEFLAPLWLLRPEEMDDARRLAVELSRPRRS